MLSHEYTYAYGAVDVVNGELDSLILPHVNTACMQIFLDEVAARHPQWRIIMVLDGAALAGLAGAAERHAYVGHGQWLYERCKR